MKKSLAKIFVGMLLLFGIVAATQAQTLNRVSFNDQELWLSGGNVAWINFARDIGPGTTDLNRFGQIFEQLHENGGNAMRLWLHTTGASTPEWNGSQVVGPGAGAIEDLRAILDTAWEHEIGLQLCLWSFDMLNVRDNPATVTDRAYDLLTDPALTQTYIDNALIPMVDSLARHPAIISWEIFNEPEGMSNEHGWDFNRHVPMSNIQRFINLLAGAIHRTDPAAKVTNGSWAFIASSDVTPTGAAAKTADQLSAAELQNLRTDLTRQYRHAFTMEESKNYYDQLHAMANFNYYTDERLIAGGGDALGVLDYYTVHYYEWAGTALSPFHHDASVWGLTKPLVIAEFFMGGGQDGNNDATFGVPYDELYTTLFDRGYAGAMAWQWFNYPNGAEGVVNWPRMLESTAEIFALHPEAVDVDPGLRIAFFRAEPPGIEAGQSSVLSWSTTGATSVTLDDVPVDSVGTMTVSPAETTTYTLSVTGPDNETFTAEVTVTVLDPDEVNRARGRSAAASTIETCCNNNASPGNAFDGDPNTRWSSEWQDGLADEDPDDEWIYVDLGAAFSIDRIELLWEVAYGSSYDIDVSYDAQVWTTVFEERNGDGGTDEIIFETPPSGRYVRMHGLERGTEYGFSIWEMGIYGLPSSEQPPTVSVGTAVGNVLSSGTSVTLVADADDPDGTVTQAVFYVDGELLSTDEEAPFEADWSAATPGEYTFTVVVTDDSNISVQSAPFSVFVDDGMMTRYEAEDATYTGQVNVINNNAASGGAFLEMRDTWTLTFSDVDVPAPGNYLLSMGYQLTFDIPKTQYLVVNGDTVEAVEFTAPNTSVWLQRGVKVALRRGTNEIAIHGFWNWMSFDFIAVGTNALNVASEASQTVPEAFSLDQNYPNPFNPETVIAYTLRHASHVRLDVYDVTGRRVAVLVDGVQPAGTHTARFDAGDLASGVYFYQIKAGSFVQTKHMVLMR